MTRRSPLLLTDSQALLASRLRVVVTRFSRRLRRHSGGELTPSQLSALVSLDRSGPLTLGELSAVEGVRPPTMTKVAGALEELGLATRSNDPSDRRVVRLAASPSGRDLLDRARSRSDAYLADRLKALDDEDRAVLEWAAALLEKMLEAEE